MLLLLLLAHLLELGLLTDDNVAVGLHHHWLARLLHCLDHVRVILLVLLAGVRRRGVLNTGVLLLLLLVHHHHHVAAGLLLLHHLAVHLRVDLLLLLLRVHRRPQGTGHAHVADRRQERMRRLRSDSSADYYAATSWTGLLRMLLLSLLLDLQLQLLRLAECGEIGRPIRHGHRRRRGGELLLALAGHGWSHHALPLLLFVAVVLHEHRVLPGLSADLIQLLLKALLFGRDAIQLASVRVVQLLVVLPQLPLAAVERFALLPQLAHFRLVINLVLPDLPETKEKGKQIYILENPKLIGDQKMAN